MRPDSACTACERGECWDCRDEDVDNFEPEFSCLCASKRHGKGVLPQGADE